MNEIVVEGHRLALRVLDAGDMLDLIEAAGDNAGNRVWMRFAMVVCSVQAVDGVPVPFPRDVAAIKAGARRFGVKALEEVQAALNGDDDALDGDMVAAKN